MFHFRKKKGADKHNDRQRDSASESTLAEPAPTPAAGAPEAADRARERPPEPAPAPVDSPVDAPTEHATSIKDTAPVGPAAPVKDTAPEEPVAPVEGTASVESVAPVEGTASVEPVAPVEDTAPIEDAAGAAPPAAPRRGWRRRLSGSGFARGLSALFTRHVQLDDALLDELETVLITADVGVNASTELVESLRTRMHKREFADARALLEALRRALLDQLAPAAQSPAPATATPWVVLVVGVNGVGKTTTIGKLAHRYRTANRKVMLAAGDTFRAAAIEQLQSWGERNDVPVLAQGHGADSASVIYDALAAARARGSDVLIADTAGRLHTQGGLMDELAKIVRVLKKLDADAPHEVLMVIDGTTGQNAISQLRQFLAAVGVTGLVVTKLDGTAKGGVMFALAREFALPIRYVGLGEGIEDLREFDAHAFVDGLLPEELGGGA